MRIVSAPRSCGYSFKVGKHMFRTRNARAFVLLSGGVDSATALYVAAHDFINITAVSLNYGQRHVRELEHANWLARQVHADHVVIDLPEVLSGANVMLTDKGAEIPPVHYDQIQGISPTYVPFRNGTMLSVLAAHATKYIMAAAATEGVEPNSPLLKDLVSLYFGAHAEDARNWAYPDCTPEFIGAMANAIYIGTYQSMRLVAPFIHSSKADIIRRGATLGVPYALTWSCYAGGEHHCGVCPTCRARKDAFRIAGVSDPTQYAA